MARCGQCAVCSPQRARRCALEKVHSLFLLKTLMKLLLLWGSLFCRLAACSLVLHIFLAHVCYSHIQKAMCDFKRLMIGGLKLILHKLSIIRLRNERCSLLQQAVTTLFCVVRPALAKQCWRVPVPEFCRNSRSMNLLKSRKSIHLLVWWLPNMCRFTSRRFDHRITVPQRRH